MARFADLVARYAGESYEKQHALADSIGDAPWQLDLDTGTITFGPQRGYPIQLLGSASERAGTWLWAWANDASDFPPAVLDAAGRLREFGTREAIAELVTPESPLEALSGDAIAAVATGVCASEGYYRCPYEGGAAFVLLWGPELRRPVDDSPVHVVGVLTRLIQVLELDHRAMVEGYLSYKGYSLTPSGDDLRAMSPGGGSLDVRFDARGRVAGLSTRART